MVQLFQQTDFSDRGAWDTFIFCFKTNPLEGDNVARIEIFGLEHDAIRTCFFFFFLVIYNSFGKTVNIRSRNRHTFSDLFNLFVLVVKTHGV